MKNKKVIKLLWDAFSCGVDYGQLKMEEERDKEETFNGFLDVVHDKKFNIPIKSQQRRQIHSQKWFEAKRKSKKDFFNILENLLTSK